MDINLSLIEEIEKNFPENIRELALVILSEVGKDKSTKQIEEVILQELRELVN